VNDIDSLFSQLSQAKKKQKDEAAAAEAMERKKKEEAKAAKKAKASEGDGPAGIGVAYDPRRDDIKAKPCECTILPAVPDVKLMNCGQYMAVR
jgi:hypothetical protein